MIGGWGGDWGLRVWVFRKGRRIPPK